jgi:DNA mismatch repair ATPase MutS
VGSFHEAYSTDNDGPNLFQLSELLNIVCTRKDKSVDIIDIKNPYMLGFPSVALSKFMKILIDHYYTIIIIDQTTPPPNPLREVTGIYSPSTFIDNISSDTKYLMVLYIEINQSITNNKSNISIGMCAVDSSTGCVFVYEKHGTNLVNEIEAIEETQRFYHYYRPIELIIYLIDNINNMNNMNNMNNINNIDDINKNNKKKEDIINKLDLLPNQIVNTYNKINPNFCNRRQVVFHSPEVQECFSAGSRRSRPLSVSVCMSISMPMDPLDCRRSASCSPRTKKRSVRLGKCVRVEGTLSCGVACGSNC